MLAGCCSDNLKLCCFSSFEGYGFLNWKDLINTFECVVYIEIQKKINIRFKHLVKGRKLN
jgi:hypothetical protein